MGYSRDELLSLRNISLTSGKYISVLRTSGICKPLRPIRGTRAGQSVKNQTFQIPVVKSQVHPVSNKQNGINHENIKTIKCTLDLSSETRFCHLNAQSCKNKTESIKDYILDKRIDICAITETWIRDKDIVAKGEIKPKGYHFENIPRGNGNETGGGIGLIYKSGFGCKFKESGRKLSFEYMHAELFSEKCPFITVLIIYRPDSTDRHPMSVFIEEFCDVVVPLTAGKNEFIICGDFNLHMDVADDRAARIFRKTYTELNLTQYVTGPTHRNGHTLDLVLTRKDSTLFTKKPYVDHRISDHDSIICVLRAKRPPLERKIVTFRKIKAIDSKSFANDIANSVLATDLSDIPETCVSQYESILSSLLDNHAPLKSQTMPVREKRPWITDEVKEMKRERRLLERTWRKDKDNIDKRDAFTDKRNKCRNRIDTNKVAHLQGLVEDKKNDPKALFHIVNNLLGKNGEMPYPEHENTAELVAGFNDFFIQKIANIREKLDNLDPSTITPLNLPIVPMPEKCLTDFAPVTEKDLLDIINAMATKSCDLDPIPTRLLKDCKEVLIPILVQIVNTVLHSGTMPKNLKLAHVIPLLKKVILEWIFKNYRPVSNLAFLGKVIEKVSAIQLVDHLVGNGLCEKFQSSYKELHSTETALLRVSNDILCALDKGHAVLLVLLDLSAAFDTLDHEILIKRLEERCGVTGNALKWFRDYLEDRYQSVIINGVESEMSKLEYGVPQGSVLGPILFTVYVLPLGDILRKHNMQFHFYADDSQLYLSFEPISDLSASETVSAIEACASDIRIFMATNKLKLNDEKTEFLVISKQKLDINVPDLHVGDATVVPSDSVRNLGSIWDSRMRMNEHVTNVCKSAYLTLHHISCIKKYLNQDTLETMIHAFITARMDYGNALLYGIPDYQIERLQRIQNYAARIVVGLRKYDHITETLIDLHWLPV